MILNYLKNIGYILVGIIGIVFISTILNYFNILGENVLNIMYIVTIIIALFIGGFLTGKKATKLGYLEGIKFGVIMIIIIIILNLIFKNSFSLSSILYYVSLLFSSTVGSMLGIGLSKN